MKRSKEEKILVAGAGGQGVMLLGKIIAEASLLEEKKVTYIRSYGAAMRGGTANCWVRISNREITTPIFENSTVSVILNSPSLEKFGSKIENNGCLIINSSLITNHCYNNRGNIFFKKIPLNEKALEMGNIKIANVIALGCLLRVRPFIKLNSAEKALEKLFKANRKILQQNKKALQGGFASG